MSTTFNPVGSAIKRLRKRAGLNRRELSDLSGVKDSTLGNYESGRMKPKMENLIKLATALKVSPEDIYPFSINTLEDAVKYRTEGIGSSARLARIGKMMSMLTPEQQDEVEQMILDKVASFCSPPSAGVA